MKVPLESLGGRIDDARHYDRLLSAAEAQALASDVPAQSTLVLSAPDTDRFTYDRASRLLTAASERYDNQVAYTYAPDSQIATETLTVDASQPRGIHWESTGGIHWGRISISH